MAASSSKVHWVINGQVYLIISLSGHIGLVCSGSIPQRPILIHVDRHWSIYVVGIAINRGLYYNCPHPAGWVGIHYVQLKPLNAKNNMHSSNISCCILCHRGWLSFWNAKRGVSEISRAKPPPQLKLKVDGSFSLNRAMTLLFFTVKTWSIWQWT